MAGGLFCVDVVDGGGDGAAADAGNVGVGIAEAGKYCRRQSQSLTYEAELAETRGCSKVAERRLGLLDIH